MPLTKRQKKALKTGKTNKYAAEHKSDAHLDDEEETLAENRSNYLSESLRASLPQQMVTRVPNLRAVPHGYDENDWPHEFHHISHPRQNLMQSVRATSGLKKRMVPVIKSIGRERAAAAVAGLGDSRVVGKEGHLPEHIRRHVDNLHAHQISDLTKTGLGAKSKRKVNKKTGVRDKSPLARGGKKTRKRRRTRRRRTRRGGMCGTCPGDKKRRRTKRRSRRRTRRGGMCGTCPGDKKRRRTKRRSRRRR